MDADLQHPPVFIGRVFELQREGFGQIVAGHSGDHDGTLRTLLSRGCYQDVNHWAEAGLVCGTGDMRMLPRCAADALLGLDERNHSEGLFVDRLQHRLVRLRGHTARRWRQQVPAGPAVERDEPLPDEGGGLRLRLRPRHECAYRTADRRRRRDPRNLLIARRLPVPA
ncbi:hypothetical protein [Streptomyces sp. 8N706]|uniref:hypothetical protein n=1 Tax=Streptomyces sp. 8N706 TaxID=3457416 RepID=UPI003FD2D445